MNAARLHVLLLCALVSSGACFSPETEDILVDRRAPERPTESLEDLSSSSDDGMGQIDLGGLPDVDMPSTICPRPEGPCGFWLYAQSGELYYVRPEGSGLMTRRLSLLLESPDRVIDFVVRLDHDRIYILNAPSAEERELVAWSISQGMRERRLVLPPGDMLRPLMLSASDSAASGVVALTATGRLLELTDDPDDSARLGYGETLGGVERDIVDQARDVVVGPGAEVAWFLLPFARGQTSARVVRVDLGTRERTSHDTEWIGLAGLATTLGPQLWTATTSGTIVRLDPVTATSLGEYRLDNPLRDRVIAVSSGFPETD